MRVTMFQPKFAPLVESGVKKQTVRPWPKRMPKTGQAFSGREWTGKPYRSAQRELVKGVITGVYRCDITENSIAIDSYAENADAFAKADGFADFEEMKSWFRKTHGLPFEGIVIYWQ